MGHFSEGPISSDWHSVSDIISQLSEKTMPWECGLALLQDTRGGASHPARSPRLQAMLDLVLPLYQTQAGNIDAWKKARETIRACDWNEQVSDGLDVSIKWSEYQALAALSSLCKAAECKLEGNRQDWRHHIAQGTLDISSYFNNINRARVARPPAPSAPLYDDRLKEIAAVERYRAVLERVSEDSDKSVFLAQHDCLAPILRQVIAEEKAAAQAEVDRINALPCYKRWPIKIARNWRSI